MSPTFDTGLAKLKIFDGLMIQRDLGLTVLRSEFVVQRCLWRW